SEYGPDVQYADELHAEGMDEIHVPDLADGRLERRLSGQNAASSLAAGEPHEPEAIMIVGEQALDADLANGAALGHRDSPVQEENRRWMPGASAAVATCSRNFFSLNICASSERSCRCSSVACSGTSSTNTCSTGRPSGESKGIGCSGRTKAPSACLRPLMRPWGIAIP